MRPAVVSALIVSAAVFFAARYVMAAAIMSGESEITLLAAMEIAGSDMWLLTALCLLGAIGTGSAPTVLRAIQQTDAQKSAERSTEDSAD